MKKSISLLLTIIMLFSVVSVSAFAANVATPKATSSNDVGGIKVYWNKVDSAVKYNVYRRVGGSSSWVLVGTTTGTQVIDKGVTNGIYYVYSVRAYNAQGDYSAYNQNMTYTTKCVATPKLTSLTNDSNGLKLTWSAVSGATYRVYRRGAGSTTWTYLGTTSSTTYTDSKATSGKYWRYTVRAVSSGYYSGFDTNGLYTMRLADPYSIKAVVVQNGVQVNWAKINGATGYRVYRRGAGQSTWTYLGAVSTNRFIDTKVAQNAYYRYTVRATNGGAISSFYSEGYVINTNLKNELVNNVWERTTNKCVYKCVFYPDGSGMILGGYITELFSYTLKGNELTFIYEDGSTDTCYMITKNSSDLWTYNSDFAYNYAQFISGDEYFFAEQDAYSVWVKGDAKTAKAEIAYYKVWRQCLYNWYGNKNIKEYALHDINDDGVPEFIIHGGSCEADRYYYFYTYSGGKAVYMGSTSASHSGLADAKGHIVLFGGHMGYGRSCDLYMVNNKIVTKNSKTFDFNYTPFPDFGVHIEFVEDNNY